MVAVGIAVLVVAVLALRNPKSPSDAAPTHTITNTPQTSSTHSTVSAHSSGTARASTGSSSQASNSSGAPATNPKKVPLIVLNNTTTPHLAQDAAQRFQSGGWTVTSYANYQNDIISTCAYYDPDSTGAKAAATALQKQYPTIKRVEPRFGGLPTGPVVVVLTPDYSAD